MKTPQKTYSIMAASGQTYLCFATDWQEARKKGREWCKSNNLRFSSCRLVRKVVESLPLSPEEQHAQRKIKKLTAIIGKRVTFTHYVNGQWQGQFWGDMVDVVNRNGQLYGKIIANGQNYEVLAKYITSTHTNTPTQVLAWNQINTKDSSPYFNAQNSSI